MKPTFWKLSQGPEYFSHKEMLDSLTEELVYVHKDTKPMASSSHSQGSDFVEASIGDYFYLTNGNQKIYLIGQFMGPANFFSKKGDGWLDRPFRLIFTVVKDSWYEGEQKWWTPNFNSTFTKIPENELASFEELILTPFFDSKLNQFEIGAESE